MQLPLTLLPLLSALPGLVSGQAWLLTQLSEVNSYKYARFTECTSFIRTCQPTISSCASAVCAQCTDLGGTALNACCADTDPVTCFSSLRAANGGSSPASAPVTAAPPPPACTSVSSIVASCEAATPGFDSLGDTEVASCFCYDAATAYAGASVDADIDSCAAFWSTEDTTEYSSLAGLQGFCASVGDVRGGGSSSGSALSSQAGGSATASATGSATATTGETSTSRASAGSSVTSSGPVATATNAAARVGVLVVHMSAVLVAVVVSAFHMMT